MLCTWVSPGFASALSRTWAASWTKLSTLRTAVPPCVGAAGPRMGRGRAARFPWTDPRTAGRSSASELLRA